MGFFLYRDKENKLLAIVLVILMLLCIASCRKEENMQSPEGLPKLEILQTSKFEKYDNGYTMLSQIVCPAVSVTNGEEFPELSASLEEMNARIKEELYSEFEENIPVAKEMYEGNPELFFYFLEKKSATIRRADNVATSVLFFRESDTGGARMREVYLSETFDTKTGEKLSIADVIADYDLFVREGAKKLDEYFSAQGLPSLADFEAALRDENMFSWTLEPNGVTLYFAPYSFASPASGIPIIPLSERETPGLIKKEYLSEDIPFIVKLHRDERYYYDVTGDGVVDEIFCDTIVADEYGDMGFCVSVNGEEYKEVFEFFSYEAYFVRTEEKRNYLLVTLDVPYDHFRTVSVELSDTPDLIDESRAKFSSEESYNGEVYTVCRPVPSDIHSLPMMERTHLIGDVTGYGTYYIGPYGAPLREKSLISFAENGRAELELICPLTLERYDEKRGSVKGEATYEKGDVLYLYGADGDDYVYFIDSENNVTRAKVECDSYPHKISGTEIGKIFDGIPYAA